MHCGIRVRKMAVIVAVDTLILDTNVVSYFMRGGDMAERYRSHVSGKLLAVGFVTVGELYFGAEKNGWGELRRRSLETTLHRFLVLPYDVEIARAYGRVLAGRQRIGRPVAPNDAWIAACAIRHTLPLLTHNAKDFEQIPDLRVIAERAPG